MARPKYHYVYMTTYANGSITHGTRSCKCTPAQDTKYAGPEALQGGVWWKCSYYKTILGVYPTRQEALDEEYKLVAKATSGR